MRIDPGTGGLRGLSPARQTFEPIDLDDIDQSLIDLLIDDGRRTNRSLAEIVGLTDATVAIRIRRMVDKGVLAIAPQFDWYVAGFRHLAVAYIRLGGPTRSSGRASRRPTVRNASLTPRAVGGVLATYPGIFSVELTYGDADLVTMLLTADETDMHDILTRISGTPGVASLRINHVVEVASWARQGTILPYEPTLLEDFPDPPFELDEIDHAIITRLRADGRESSRETAGYVGVSDATVRSRRRRLEEAGLMRVRALFDPFRSGRLGAAVHIGLVVTGDVKTVLAKLSAERSVNYCATALGEHNVIGALMAQGQEELAYLLTEGLWNIDGVVSVQAWPFTEVIIHRSDLFRFV
jgi:DNA-binding Lrp family transcriptional regulator